MTVLGRLNQQEFDTWLAEAVPSYAADKVASGQWTQPGSIALSIQEHAQLLPQGLATPDNHFFAILDVSVGMLWFAVKTKFGGSVAFLYSISVKQEHRRQGHATQAMLALEQEARGLGLTGVALHVFGHNAGARALNAELGYEPTNISLFKPLAEPEA